MSICVISLERVHLCNCSSSNVREMTLGEDRGRGGWGGVMKTESSNAAASADVSFVKQSRGI